MTKVIVISDIKIYCEGLKDALSDTNSIIVSGAANSFNIALDIIEHETPNLVLLDMTMMNSCRFAREISRLYPGIKIVALSVSEHESNIMACAEAGIAGYVAREATLDELLNTIIGTMNGEFHCPPKIAECIFKTVNRLAQGSKDQTAPVAAHPNHKNLAELLTNREQQIYELMVKGLSNKKISHNLIIEVSTVKNHVHNILVKLDVKSRAQAVTLLQGNTFFWNTNQNISSPTFC